MSEVDEEKQTSCPPVIATIIDNDINCKEENTVTTTSNPLHPPQPSPQLSPKPPLTRERSLSRTASLVMNDVIEKENRSPFVKHAEVKLSTSEFILAWVYKVFVKSVPMASVKKLKPNRLICFGLMAHAICIAFFLGFAISSYIQLGKEEFVSLKEDAGICSKVEKPISGYFVAGANGKWQGDVNFVNSLGAYEFNFNSMKVNEDEFATEFQKLHDNELMTIGNYQAELGLHYNLLFWMHFSTYFTVGDKVQSFGFTAEPGDVFDRTYFAVQLEDHYTICPATPSVTFNPTYARVVISYDINDYRSNNCHGIVYPELLGYISEYDGDIFAIDIDLVSLTSALSVNMGILDKSHLQKIGSPLVEVMYDTNAFVDIQLYYDPRYPRMAPLYCFEGAVGDGVASTEFVGQCASNINDQALIPVFFPYYGTCQHCEGTNDLNYECNDIFDLVVGYIYFDLDNLNQTIRLLNQYPNRRDMINVAYEAYTTGDFSFCDYDCSLIVINVYDENDQFISPHFYSLTNGHCQDSTEKDSFLTLGQNPPTDLVEEYYRCKNSKSTSFFKSVGLANSNMMLFSPFVFFFFMTPLILMYHKYIVKEEIDDSEFPEAERSKALSVLATHLLNLSHSKEKGYPDPDRVIVQLAQELNTLGKESEDKSSGPL